MSDEQKRQQPKECEGQEFVPGRLCLFGEHSDWAAEYSKTTPRIRDSEQRSQYSLPWARQLAAQWGGIVGTSERKGSSGLDSPGLALVSSTGKLGIYAKYWTHKKASETPRLHMVSTAYAPHGVLPKKKTVSLPLTVDGLKEVVKSGKHEYFQYVAGSLAVVLRWWAHPLDFDVWIDNYKTTLPMGKGLSSSAAVNVLICRVMNRVLYGVASRREQSQQKAQNKEQQTCQCAELRSVDAKSGALCCHQHRRVFSVDAEINMAYLGEREVGSMCGKLDQSGCAYGEKFGLVMVSFIGRHSHVLPAGERGNTGPNHAHTCHLLVVDLRGHKNTKRILSDLNACFQTPRTEPVCSLLGPFNFYVNALASCVLLWRCETQGCTCPVKQQSIEELRWLWTRFVMPDSKSALDMTQLIPRLLRGVASHGKTIARTKTWEQVVGQLAAALRRNESVACVLGLLMSTYQVAFDAACMPVSKELESPLLHRVLADKTVAKHTFGGKGVGSQGDGCAQLVCRSEHARRALQKYLSETLHMASYGIDL